MIVRFGNSRTESNWIDVCAGNAIEPEDAAALGKVLEATAPVLTSLILADNDLQVCMHTYLYFVSERHPLNDF